MKHLIASELSGFKVQFSAVGILVSLNRPISTMEVKVDHAFEGIEFIVRKLSDNTVVVRL
jgi:hypothetical protein